MATIERVLTFAAPGQEGSPVELKSRYDNFIGGHWVAPVNGEYSENLTPATGEPFTEVPRSTPEDVELALDAAHAAKDAWGETLGDRALARAEHGRGRDRGEPRDAGVAESWENGKPVRETLAADIPLAVDHFRYFASVIRGEEGSISEIDKTTVAYHFREPLGVVGQIIPFNFPLLMAAWKLAPALAAGNTVVLKPASPTPWSILKLMELLEDIVPPGVINVVNGPGAEIGKALATSKRIAKIAFTGETVTGRLIMQYAAQNIIPSTTELGGKSPNIFFADVMAEDDDVSRQGGRRARALRVQQGRGLHRTVAGADRGVDLRRVHGAGAGADRRDPAGPPARPRHAARRAGLDGAAREDRELRRDRQAGRRGAADRWRARHLGGELKSGYYFQPTVFKGTNDMRIFQEEIFGPVLAVTTFRTRPRRSRSRTTRCTVSARASGRGTRARRSGWAAGSRPVACGRTATTSIRPTPSFGGYKASGVGRENHKMMLDHYSQTKCMLVSYDPKPLGFF